MRIESKKVLALGEFKDFESICTSCVFKGCTNCPSIVEGRNEKIEDYPQIISATQGDLKIIVHKCKSYVQKDKKKIEVDKPKYVWDRKLKKHVKVIK